MFILCEKQTKATLEFPSDSRGHFGLKSCQQESAQAEQTAAPWEGESGEEADVCSCHHCSPQSKAPTTAKSLVVDLKETCNLLISDNWNPVGKAVLMYTVVSFTGNSKTVQHPSDNGDSFLHQHKWTNRGEIKVQKTKGCHLLFVIVNRSAQGLQSCSVFSFLWSHETFITFSSLLAIITSCSSG